MKLKTLMMAGACALTPLALNPTASAFCGFYVAKADTDLFNDASKVAIARDGDRTVVTMASDYRGEASEFAMVIPVVDVPERGQINVANPALIDHLDAYTAPRLVEYFDPNPCERPELEQVVVTARRNSAPPLPSVAFGKAEDLGVTIEAEYEVGEYDICLLYTSPSPRDQRGSRMPSSA